MKNFVPDEEHILNAYEFLIAFLNKFDTAQRWGIHDFMEIALYNMIGSSVKNIDSCLKIGHKEVSANEIMSIVADSYQKVVDSIKCNLDSMDKENFL